MDGSELILAVGVPWQPHERSQEVPKCNQGSPKGGRLALETPRFANAEALAHEQTQVVTGNVHQQPFGDVLLVVLRQPDIRAPTGADSGPKVMPPACSRASTPTSGARSVSEWGCILPVRRSRPPVSVASEWRRLVAVRPRGARSGGAGRRLRAARLSGPCSAAGRLSAPARPCPERGESVTCGSRQSTVQRC